MLLQLDFFVFLLPMFCISLNVSALQKKRMLGVFVNNIFEISNTSLSVLKMIV